MLLSAVWLENLNKLDDRCIGALTDDLGIRAAPV
jgi:hypothetical protein